MVGRRVDCMEVITAEKTFGERAFCPSETGSAWGKNFAAATAAAAAANFFSKRYKGYFS